MIDQTYADELVPTTGVLAQAQGFDTLGQRYDLFIHTGADHLGFAIEDRFSDAVAALGNPVRQTNPGAFTYDWYPSLNSATLGIGATGDYWISGLGRADCRIRDGGLDRRQRQRATGPGGGRATVRADPGHPTAAGHERWADLEARHAAAARARSCR